MSKWESWDKEEQKNDRDLLGRKDHWRHHTKKKSYIHIWLSILGMFVFSGVLVADMSSTGTTYYIAGVPVITILMLGSMALIAVPLRDKIRTDRW